jgi:hypothetical protein
MDGASRIPSGVPVPSNLGAVEVEIGTAGEAGASMVGLEIQIGVRDVSARRGQRRCGGARRSRLDLDKD